MIRAGPSGGAIAAQRPPGSGRTRPFTSPMIAASVTRCGRPSDSQSTTRSRSPNQRGRQDGSAGWGSGTSPWPSPSVEPRGVRATSSPSISRRATLRARRTSRYGPGGTCTVDSATRPNWCGGSVRRPLASWGVGRIGNPIADARYALDGGPGGATFRSPVAASKSRTRTAGSSPKADGAASATARNPRSGACRRFIIGAPPRRSGRPVAAGPRPGGIVRLGSRAMVGLAAMRIAGDSP